MTLPASLKQASGEDWLPDGQHHRQRLIEQYIDLRFVIPAQCGAEILLPHRGNGEGLLLLEISGNKPTQHIHIAPVVARLHNERAPKLFPRRSRDAVENFLRPSPHLVVVAFFAEGLRLFQTLLVGEGFFQPPQRFVNSFGGVASVGNERKNLLADIAGNQPALFAFKHPFGAVEKIINDGGVIPRHPLFYQSKTAIHVPYSASAEQETGEDNRLSKYLHQDEKHGHRGKDGIHPVQKAPVSRQPGRNVFDSQVPFNQRLQQIAQCCRSQ